MSRNQEHHGDTRSAMNTSIDRRTLLTRVIGSGISAVTLQHVMREPITALATQVSPPTIPGPPWEGGQRGGTGRVAWPDDNITLDPPLAYDLGGYYGIANFYRGLFYYGLNTEPQPDLLDSMDISDDGKHYQFKIKRGATFHNGREVSANDFKATWERACSKELASWVQGFLGSVQGHADFVNGNAGEIAGIKVIDNYTIELVLDHPDPTIPGVLGIPPFFVLPVKEMQEAGERFRFTMGSGPWKLEEFDESRRVYRCSRFPDYIYADHLPYFDELDWEWGVDSQLQAQRVLAGKLEATGANLLPATALQQQRAGAEEDVFKLWETLTIVWFDFDTTRPPFDNPLVRKAFNYALNKDRLRRLLINPTGHFYPPALLGYDVNLPVYDYDPEQARALLKDAGADGLKLTLPIWANSTGDIQQLLQQDLAEIGVTIELQQEAGDVYDYGAKLIGGRYHFWPRGWGMGLPDPSEIVNSLIGTSAPSNFTGYGNPRIDELGKEAQATLDRAKRAELYAEIERLLLDDAPFLFVGVLQWATLKRPELKNFIWEPVLFEHWDRYWLQSE